MDIPRKLREIKRFRQILAVLGKYELQHVFSHGNKHVDPSRLRQAFEKLDGTFIKLGQLLSLRPDLIPGEYCKEFEKLQDELKPFPFPDVKNIIETELKKPLNKAFSSFEKKPVSAASIGQVHRAVLLNGNKVAVKVKRPNVEKTFQADLDILEMIAKFMEEHYNNRVIDYRQIVKEFEDYTNKEMDYLREAHNINVFRELQPNIKIPRVYDELTTKNVLTMEFIDGTRIDRVKRDKKNLSRRIALIIMDGIFSKGIFHADPHPGNIFLTKDNQLALLDFGIIGRVDDGMKENLRKMFIALIGRDTDGLADSLTSLDFARKKIDKAKFRNDLADLLGKYYNTSLDKIDFSQLLANSIRVARENNVTLPKNLVLMTKSLISMEGLALELNPQFNIVKVAEPFLENLAEKELDPKKLLKNTMKDIFRYKSFFRKLPEKADSLERTIEIGEESLEEIKTDLDVMNNQLRMLSNKTILSIIFAALIISGAYVYNTNPKMSAYAFYAAGIALLILVLSVFNKQR